MEASIGASGATDELAEVRLLSSFVPALMLKAMAHNNAAIEPPMTQDYEAVALFADISGFSALNEHFSQQGGDGLGNMMSVVNMYFQQMIKITSACGGDIIKFAGDALIVLWTEGEPSVLAHRACECAMELQDALHDCPMTQTIRLSLKIGVGLGKATMFYVGGHGGRCEYFASGPALRECFDACDIAHSGDVIVSSEVCKLIQDECEAEVLESGHMSLTSMQKTFRKRSVSRFALSTSAPYKSLRRYAPNALLSAHALEAALGQSVRSWTVSVVQASVLFVNLGIGGLMDQQALDCNKIHTAVVTVQRIVHLLQGTIHRFTVDDKGCVMKVVFGAQLPHEDQPYRALLAALQLRQALSLQGIQPAVGVASGQSLIGPVGSAVRQEFTVHGDKIIFAARLMQLATKYGGMVLCDEQTYAATRDDVRFVQLQPVQLKGKRGSVRPYRPVASSELLHMPTLTAKPEGSYCISSLEPVQRAISKAAEWAAASEGAGFLAFNVTGSHGGGKSQLVMQVRARLQDSCRVLHVRCRGHEMAQHGALSRRLFAQLCGHDVWPSLLHMTPMLKDQDEDVDRALIEYELKLLRSHAAAGQRPLPDSPAGAAAADAALLGSSPQDRREEEGKTQSASARLVILIDDVQYADAHSCNLLARFAEGEPANVFMLLTCREPSISLGGAPKVRRQAQGGGETAGDDEDEERISPGHRLVCTLSAKITAINLRPVGATGCEELACAELGVKSLPAEVTALLAHRSGGSPLLCQSIVRNLVRRGALLVESNGSSRLGVTSSERLLNAAATEALVESRHSFLYVKLSSLTIIQQLVLKTMALLPEPCPQATLIHALPLQIDHATLSEQLRALRSTNIIKAPASHRRSLPGVLQNAPAQETLYCFVDVGMREVCQHLMVEPQKRQIRLRVAATNESKQVLGSLADSITSSNGGDDLARSLSPNMLRESRTKHWSSSPLSGRPSNVGTGGLDTDGSGRDDDFSFTSSTSADDNANWWLSRSPANVDRALAGRRYHKGASSSSSSSPSRLLKKKPTKRDKQRANESGRAGGSFRGSPLAAGKSKGPAPSPSSSKLRFSYTEGQGMSSSPSAQQTRSPMWKPSALSLPWPSKDLLRTSNRSSSRGSLDRTTSSTSSSPPPSSTRRVGAARGRSTSREPRPERAVGAPIPVRMAARAVARLAHSVLPIVFAAKLRSPAVRPGSIRNRHRADSGHAVLAALEDAGLDVADVAAPQLPSTPATMKDFGDGASSRPKNLVVLPSHLSNLSAIGEKSLDGHMSRLAQRSESPEGRAHSGLAMMVGTARRGGAGTNGGTDHGDIKEEGQMKPHAARKLFD